MLGKRSKTNNICCLNVDVLRYWCEIWEHDVYTLKYKLKGHVVKFSKWAFVLSTVQLDLVTLNLVTTCGLVTVLQRPFFKLLDKIIRFSDNLWFSDTFTVYMGTIFSLLKQYFEFVSIKNVDFQERNQFFFRYFTPEEHIHQISRTFSA